MEVLTAGAGINSSGIGYSPLNFGFAYSAWLTGATKDEKTGLAVAGALFLQRLVLPFRKRHSSQGVAALTNLQGGSGELADLPPAQLPRFARRVNAGDKQDLPAQVIPQPRKKRPVEIHRIERQPRKRLTVPTHCQIPSDPLINYIASQEFL